MLKFLVFTTVCCLATTSPTNDRLTKLEKMVAEQQTAMEEQKVIINQLKRQLAGINIFAITAKILEKME